MEEYKGELEFVKHSFITFSKIYCELNFNGPIKSCHVAFVHTYSNGGKDKNKIGKPCIVLGKDNSNEYNFVGGKVDNYNKYDKYDVIINKATRTLYRELYEEFGSVPTKNFLNSIIFSINASNSLLLVVNVTGISSTKLNKMIRNKPSYLPYYFHEIKQYDNIIIDKITSYNCSNYVKEYIEIIKLIYQFNNHPHIPYNVAFTPATY